MGGIVVSLGDSPREKMFTMLEKLEHRGPSWGTWSRGQVTLGHRGQGPGDLEKNQAREGKVDKRDDPAGDVPPGRGGSREISAVLDGYLHSHRMDPGENLKELSGALGRDKKSYLRGLDGTFAFAVSDGEELLAARDPFGIKPLYYGSLGDNLYFTSEIKALQAVTPDINIFPPGSYYQPGQGFRSYLERGKGAGEPKDKSPYGHPGEAASDLKRKMIKAVEKRLEGGEEPGVLLSGGLDSSIVAAAASQFSDQVKTFSVGVEGSPDLEAAETVAKSLGTRHYQYVYSLQEILQVLPRVIYHLESYDAPLVQSAIANYFASRMAAQEGCGSILCGEGADELFAGYHYIKDMPDQEQVEKELEKIMSIGHAMGFQRVDRMNSAHSLESHVPFMDRSVCQVAGILPLDWKIYGEQQVEKWILRVAFDGELPAEIVWRKKEQFSHGTGCNEVMGKLAGDSISDQEFARERDINGSRRVRTKEELLYYRLFKLYYPQEDAVESVALWSDF